MSRMNKNMVININLLNNLLFKFYYATVYYLVLRKNILRRAVILPPKIHVLHLF